MKKLLALTLIIYGGIALANPHPMINNTHSTTAITNGSKSISLQNGVSNSYRTWAGNGGFFEAGVEPETELVDHDVDPDTPPIAQETGNLVGYYSRYHGSYDNAHETTEIEYSFESSGDYSGVTISATDGQLVASSGTSNETMTIEEDGGQVTTTYHYEKGVWDEDPALRTGINFNDEMGTAVFGVGEEDAALTWAQKGSTTGYIDENDAADGVASGTVTWGVRTDGIGADLSTFGPRIEDYGHTETTVTTYDRLYLNHYGN